MARNDPFFVAEAAINKLRTLEFYKREDTTTVTTDEDTQVAVDKLFSDVLTLADKAQLMSENAATIADKHLIPIDEDSNETRAAHLRAFQGDGKAITFAQFRSAVDGQRGAWKEFWDYGEFSGYGEGDLRKIDRKKIVANLNSMEGPTGANYLETLATFGSSAMILWALNQLIGGNHAMDHSMVTSVKFPPATEIGGVMSQMIKAFIMSLFIQGLSETASKDLAKMDIPEGFDPSIIDRAYEQAVNSPPPTSDAYRAFSATRADADRDRVIKYSTDYMAGNLWEGYEAWWAYLTAHNVEDSARRDYKAGGPYMSGQTKMGPDHRNLVQSKVNGGNDILDRMNRVMRSGRGASETCCLLRFLDAIDIDILEMISSILEMAISLIEMRARMALNWYMKLANHPWDVISGEVLRVLDEFFEKIADKVLSIFDLDGEGMKVMRACLPIDELIKSVLDVLEYMKEWYHDLIAEIGEQYNKMVQSQSVGWEEALGVKKAKETLRALNAMIEYKATSDQTTPLEDNRLNALIAEVQDASYTYDLLGTGEEVGDALGAANELTRDIVEICRGLGDWDQIKATAAKAL